MDGLIGRLIGCLMAWSIDSLIAWLLDCPIDQSIHWLMDGLIDRLVDWMIAWLIDCLESSSETQQTEKKHMQWKLVLSVGAFGLKWKEWSVEELLTGSVHARLVLKRVQRFVEELYVSSLGPSEEFWLKWLIRMKGLHCFVFGCLRSGRGSPHLAVEVRTWPWKDAIAAPPSPPKGIEVRDLI